MAARPLHKGKNDMKIDNATLARIKAAAGIVDVVGDFCELRKKGRDYQCLCPFHDDHHLGSFVVSPRRNTYTCFACGAHGDAIEFLMRHEGMTFFEAVAWLGKKYGIEVEGGNAVSVRPSKPREAVPPLPLLTLPLGMVTARLDTSGDALCNWIRGLHWSEAQRGRVERVLKAYAVGHSRQGYTMFWQIDERGQVRTGKFMLYRADGHRDKATGRSFTWAHTLLARAGRIDLDKAEMRQTLFGMHLLTFHPDAEVDIVESEKTALLASIMWGHPEKRVWMACGGLAMLSRERLLPLIAQQRCVRLFPDRDGVTAWRQQALLIGYKGLEVDTMHLDRYWRKEDGEKADLADVIVASLQVSPNSIQRERADTPQALPDAASGAARDKQGGATKTGEASFDRVLALALAGLCQRNPHIRTLAGGLDLEPVRVTYDAQD